jgi:hypothetical protein
VEINSKTLKMRGGIMCQANRYLGGFCSSQRSFLPQTIQGLLNIFTLAFIAALYPALILVRANPISSLFGKYWGRTNVIHQSTQAEEINLASIRGSAT